MHEIKISIELRIFRNVSIQKYNYQVKIKSGRIENVDDKARKLAILNCWLSHDVTKIQTKEFSNLPEFTLYIEEQLKANLYTNFH